MNKEIKLKIVNHFEEHAEKYSVKLAARGYTVNCKAGQAYPRDVFSTIEDSVDALVSRGEGFELGASFTGGWSHGNTSATGDVGITMGNNELLRLLFSDNE